MDLRKNANEEGTPPMGKMGQQVLEIYEKLGQGGFSKVYKCMDTTDKRNVRALKYVDLAKVDRASEKGILNEIEHLTQLKWVHFLTSVVLFKRFSKSKKFSILINHLRQLDSKKL